MLPNNLVTIVTKKGKWLLKLIRTKRMRERGSERQRNFLASEFITRDATCVQRKMRGKNELREK